MLKCFFVSLLAAAVLTLWSLVFWSAATPEADWTAAKPTLKGFSHLFVCCGLMALLMLRLSRFLGSYGQRVLVVVWIGVIMAVFGDLGSPIRHLDPWQPHWLRALHTTTTWLFGGAILGWFLHGDQ